MGAFRETHHLGGAVGFRLAGQQRGNDEADVTPDRASRIEGIWDSH